MYSYYNLIHNTPAKLALSFLLLPSHQSHFTNPLSVHSFLANTLLIIPSHSHRSMFSQLYVHCVCCGVMTVSQTVSVPARVYVRTSKDMNQNPSYLLLFKGMTNLQHLLSKRHLWLLSVVPLGCYITRHNQPTHHSSIPQLMASWV